MAAAKGRLEELQSSLEGKRRLVTESESTLQKVAAEIEECRAELGSAVLGKLTAEEKREESRLRTKLTSLEVISLPGHCIDSEHMDVVINRL